MDNLTARRIPPLRACKSQQLGKGQWRGKYQDGVRFSPFTKEFATKKAADDWAGKQVAAIREGRHIAADKTGILMDHWCPRWLDLQTVKQGSRNRYRSAVRLILTYFTGYRVQDIREEHVQAWMAWMTREEYAHSSRVYSMKILMRIMGSAQRNGYTVIFPCTEQTYSKPDPAPAPKTGTTADGKYYACSEEIWQIYDAIDDPGYRIAVVLGAFFGLRISEIAGARIEDMDWDTLTYTPGLQYRKPSDRDPHRPDTADDTLKRPASMQPFPVDPWAAQHLRELLDGRTTGPMILVNGTRVTTPHITAAIGTAVDTVGGPMAERVQLGRRQPERRFTTHGLRHYYASILLAVGETIATVTQKVRHKSPVTTLQVYTHAVNAGKQLQAGTLGQEAQRGRTAATTARWNQNAA